MDYKLGRCIWYRSYKSIYIIYNIYTVYVHHKLHHLVTTKKMKISSQLQFNRNLHVKNKIHQLRREQEKWESRESRVKESLHEKRREGVCTCAFIFESNVLSKNGESQVDHICTYTLTQWMIWESNFRFVSCEWEWVKKNVFFWIIKSRNIMQYAETYLLSRTTRDDEEVKVQVTFGMNPVSRNFYPSYWCDYSF